MKTKFKRFFTWYHILNKRLFQKRSFLIMLAAVPVLVFSMRFLAFTKSGTVNIALYAGEDPAAQSAAEQLLKENSIISITAYTQKEDVYTAVASGTADEAWIFSADTSKNLAAYASGEKYQPAVEIVEREDNVFHQLAREKLYATMFSDISYQIYKNYITGYLSDDGRINQNAMEKDYQYITKDEKLVEFSSLEGGVIEEDQNYLMAPLRGLLALMIPLAALSSSLYFMHDNQKDCYVWLKPKEKTVLSLFYNLIAAGDMAVAVLLALAVSGLLTSWLKEIGFMLLYCIASTMFANLVRYLCRKEERLGAVILVIMMVMLAMSPIFLNLKNYRWIQYLLPSYHYLHAVQSQSYTLLLIGYTVSILLINILVEWAIRKMAGRRQYKIS